MKKLFLLLIAGLSIVACKKYDDSELVADIAALEGEVASLQQSNAALAADLSTAQAALSSDIAANASDISTIQADLASLLDMLAEAQAASTEGDAQLNNAIADASVAIGNLQGQIDALEGISASYDEATGQVTIILANGTSYSTGDLRGATGSNGSSGSNGSNGLDGLDASEEAILTSGLEAAAGVEANWLPAWATQIADFVQTVRFSHNFGGNKGMRTVFEERNISVVADTLPSNTRNDGDPFNVYGYGGNEYTSLGDAQAAAVAAETSGTTVTITQLSRQPQISAAAIMYTGTVTGTHATAGTVVGSRTINLDGVAAAPVDTAGADIDYVIPAGPPNTTWIDGSGAAGETFTYGNTGYSFVLSGSVVGSFATITLPDGSTEGTAPIAGDNDFSQTIAVAKSRVEELYNN